MLFYLLKNYNRFIYSKSHSIYNNGEEKIWVFFKPNIDILIFFYSTNKN